MKCKCHPQSAFHWNRPDYKPSIVWSKHSLSDQLSAASSAHVNKMRAQGKDVIVVSGLNTNTYNPKKYVVERKAA